MIFLIYFAVWASIFIESYGLRLRRVICSFFYRKREKIRVLYLYNQMLKKRKIFISHMRKKILKQVSKSSFFLPSFYPSDIFYVLTSVFCFFLHFSLLHFSYRCFSFPFCFFFFLSSQPFIFLPFPLSLSVYFVLSFYSSSFIISLTFCYVFCSYLPFLPFRFILFLFFLLLNIKQLSFELLFLSSGLDD